MRPGELIGLLPLTEAELVTTLDLALQNPRRSPLEQQALLSLCTKADVWAAPFRFYVVECLESWVLKPCGYCNDATVPADHAGFCPECTLEFQVEDCFGDEG